MVVQLSAGRARLQLLEAVRELERLRIEQRELLLHCDREVLSRLERLVREADLLVGTSSLLIAHLTSVNEGIQAPAAVTRTAPAAVRRRCSSSIVRRPRGVLQGRAPSVCPPAGRVAPGAWRPAPGRRRSQSS